jgi:hypothetical protein
MSSGPDRRAHPRADADFTLSLDLPSPQDQGIRVKDISKAGICCFLEEPIPVMTEVAVRLVIPEPGGESTEIRCNGAIVRCDPPAESSLDARESDSVAASAGPSPTPAPGPFEVAIFFLDLDEPERAVIERYVRSRNTARSVGQPA